MPKQYLGYNDQDRRSDYAAFYHETLAALPAAVNAALSTGALPWGALPDVGDLPSLEKTGYAEVENGYAVNKDGSVAVAVRTEMPDVTPAMWDWWFGWHGSQDLRYKLWHPGAHLSARWEDGKNDACYVGRNSIIREYIGKEPLDAVIQFKSPLDFGFSYEAVNRKDQAVYICAKLGHPDLPVDYGYLVHQVRATANGAEMRSRFFIGGRYAGVRKRGKLAAMVTDIVRRFKSLPENFGADLLRHCSEEMNHLAGFLPALYRQYHSDTQLAVNGEVYHRAREDFNKIIISNLYNKMDTGRIPDMLTEPRTVEDVIHIVRYAKKTGKRVTVLSGGRSFSANSIRPDCIVISMKHFDQYKVNKDAMSAEAGPAVGGSVLLKALFKMDLFFPAGHCTGVCIGGFLLQGGYGWNGRKTGIACQSILGMDIITADGELVHANETENADLFWAARGSGPGFFGVVVKFYLKLYPLPPYRAIIAHDFSIQHLEDVYRWAYDVGPDIPKAVEFQMLMSKNMMNVMGPGIEAFAPIFADTEDEFEAAKAFMHNSPIKKKAIVATPAFNPGIDVFYRATMTHYPANYHYGVDNMWTHAPIDELLPFIKKIAETLPPPPSHFLWLNWYPDPLSVDMAYSVEDNIYLALYSSWKNARDTEKYNFWAADMIREMQHLSSGIQLADEGLHKRTDHFLKPEHLKRVQEIRAKRDPQGVFFEWHSKPGA
ncbi:MAG TPA: FAD-binding protein [Saprospiraceae bacterium]|nr:FAD-binding protein [Saprospiraceae bacterium]